MKIHSPFRTALVATLGVGVGFLLLVSVQTLSQILLYLGTALFLSLGLEPIISFFERRRLPRWAAVLITLLILLAAFAGILLLIVPVIVGQISQLVSEIQSVIASGVLNDPVDTIRQWLTTTFPALNVDDIFTFVQNWFATLDVGAIGGSVGQAIIAIGGGIIAGLGGAFIILILTIYLTSSTPSLKQAVYQLVPASKRPNFVGIAEQITDSVGFFVIGQLTLGAANGVLSAILLTLIHAPFPAVLAVIAFLGSIIPLVGTLSSSAIIVLVCFIPGLETPAWTPFVALVYYLVYMQVEAYVLSPRIMSRAVSVPGAVVVIAALAGGSLLGLLGALVAIPVAASILIIYRQVIIPRQNER